jgi:hypothetical protein
MAAARAYLPRLLRRAIRQHDIACIETAWWLASPPFALGALSLLLAAGLSAIANAWTLTAIFAAAFATLGVALVTGLIQARARPRTWLALCVAPWYLPWKAIIQLRAIASVLRRDDYYAPTARA